VPAETALLTPPGRRDTFLAVTLASFAFIVFLLSPVRQVSDSSYMLLVAESLLRSHDLDVDEFLPEHGPMRATPGAIGRNLESDGGHLYYFFPNAGAVLSVPLVAALDRLGISAVDGGRYDRTGEVLAQGVIASMVMAAFVVTTFLTLRLMLPWQWSAVLSLLTAFGTQVWSTTSRVLWSDAWGILILSIVVWLLMRLEIRGAAPPAVLFGTLLAWLYFVRPTNSVHFIVALVYLMSLDVRKGAVAAVTAAAWLAGFVTLSFSISGRWLPPYFAPQRLGATRVLEALAGTLVSPSRGLLVCVPISLFVLYLLARHRSAIPRLRVVPFAIAGCVAHLLPIAFFEHWWGGYSYGARLTTGLLPWAVILAGAAVAAWLDARGSGRRLRSEVAVGLILAAASIFINARGAWAWATVRWNYRPVSVDAQPGRLWDWRYPQWLAGIVSAPDSLRFPTLAVGQVLELGREASESYLGSGWGMPEENLRWSEADTAEVGFSVSTVDPVILRLVLQPGPAWRGVATGQPLDVELNGHPVATWRLTDPSPGLYAVGLPLDSLQERNRLVLRVDDRVAAGTSTFEGRIPITAAYWMQLTPYPVLSEGQPLRFADPASDAHIGEGWGKRELEYRWTTGRQAELFFRRASPEATIVALTMHPFLAPGLPVQRIAVKVNGALDATVALQDPVPRTYALPFVDSLSEFNVLRLELLDAQSPYSLGLGPDRRRLGMAAHSIALRSFPALQQGQRVPMDTPGSERYLGQGWSAPEGPTRWTDGLNAYIFFAAETGAEGTLTLDAEPFLASGLPSQRVRLNINGTALAAAMLNRPARARISFRLPAVALRRNNVVTLSFPDARSPASLGLSPDYRRLGIRVHAIGLER
jgi:hypothetical protein